MHNQLYVNSLDEGLLHMVNDSLLLVPESDQFKDDWVVVMLPWDEDTVLFGTIGQGLFIFKDGAFEPFQTEVDQFLPSSGLYLPGAILHDGTLALNTRNAGLLILDREGRLLHHIDEEKGLPTNDAYFVYQDSEAGLWAALGNGIARLDLPSPLTYIDRPDGMPLGPLSFGVLGENVYVGSSEGVFLVDTSGGIQAHRRPFYDHLEHDQYPGSSLCLNGRWYSLHS